MHQTLKNEHGQLSTEVNRMREAETRQAKQLEEAQVRILLLETMAVNVATVTNKSSTSTSSQNASHAAGQSVSREEIRAAKYTLAHEWAQ